MNELRKLKVVRDHTHLIGKVAKTNHLAVYLEREYVAAFGIGNVDTTESCHYYCHCGGRYEMSLVFIDQPVFRNSSLTWYCLKEIGTGVNGDWHWFTLDQLFISEPNQL